MQSDGGQEIQSTRETEQNADFCFALIVFTLKENKIEGHTVTVFKYAEVDCNYKRTNCLPQ